MPQYFHDFLHYSAKLGIYAQTMHMCAKLWENLGMFHVKHVSL